MENYQEKARENFYRNRPYGIHIDYARKGFVLFNHYTNSLGKQETGSIEGLPLEKFEDVDAIPLNGKIIKMVTGQQTSISIQTIQILTKHEVGYGCSETV